MTESQILEIVTQVVDAVLKKVRTFGYFTKEELRQQAFLFAFEAIEYGKYNYRRPLGGYLRTSIIRKFINLYRDKVKRNESPCLNCVFYDKHFKKSENQCAAFKDKMSCKKFKKYSDRNEAKKNLMNLKGEHNIFDNHLSFDSKELQQLEENDFIDIIKKHLIPTHRKWLQAILVGEKIDATKLEILKTKVVKILANEKI